MTHQINAPTPDLRIVPTASLHPHEWHDRQRALPLIERLRADEFVINPLMVAPLDDAAYVVLDGANRCYAFAELGYPHMLVQVMPYDSGYVELETWNHVLSGWSLDQFLDQLTALPDIALIDHADAHAIAHVFGQDDRVLSLQAPVETTHERNAALVRIVQLYQTQARLYRTTTREPLDVWRLYPDAAALVAFPRYEPADIIAAARYQAYLPPGISRHIVHGRAVRVNYPMAALADPTTPLEAKNAQLQAWLSDRFARRQVRYYAEATYQFDE